MAARKTVELYSDFKKALKRLQDGLSENPAKNSIVVDGTIQRFEFTFELAWKLLRAVLRHHGIEAETPRIVIKEAFQAGWIHRGAQWIDMLEDRNKTSHIYDEEEALRIYRKVKKNHAVTLKEFSQSISRVVS